MYRGWGPLVLVEGGLVTLRARSGQTGEWLYVTLVLGSGFMLDRVDPEVV